ncbi:MAG: formylglycine-generating enzyme family protein [Spirochaetales bacterium]|nr:formylglycine-generating enzyme family protein [Spirochaetales bacterium]
MDEFEFETVVLNKKGEVFKRIKSRASQFSEVLSSDLSIEMVYIEGGILNMGEAIGLCFEDNKPVHPVSIPSFYLGKYPVTREQYKFIIGKFPPVDEGCLKRPVERVSWFDAKNFCKKLTKITGRKYRLPGEAEWEYACKAGTNTPFYFGETITTEYVNFVGLYSFAGEPKGNYRHKSTEVGIFPPNLFGIYDMHGNVFEWCEDSWHPNYINAPDDAHPRVNNSEDKVIRGGSWHEPPEVCSSITRVRYNAHEPEDRIGFRIALSE